MRGIKFKTLSCYTSVRVQRAAITTVKSVEELRSKQAAARNHGQGYSMDQDVIASDYYRSGMT